MNFVMPRVGEREKQEKTLKVLTFQHKGIVNEIENKGIYYCDVVSDLNKRIPKTYKYLTDKLKQTMFKGTSAPIFCWSKVNGMNAKVSNNFVAEMLTLSNANLNECYLYELELPLSKCLNTNYHNFMCLCQNEEKGVLASDISNYDIFNIESCDTVQTITDGIGMSQIVDYYTIEKFTKFMNDGKQEVDYNIANIDSLADMFNYYEVSLTNAGSTYEVIRQYNSLLNELKNKPINVIRNGNYYYKFDKLTLKMFVCMLFDDNKIDTNLRDIMFDNNLEGL